MKSMRTPAFFLCLALCASACISGKAEDQMDLRDLIDQADLRFRGRDSQGALESYRLAAMIANQEGEEPALVVAASGVAMVLSLDGEFTEAGTWHTQAKQYARPEDGEAWIRFLLSGGVLLIAEGLPAEGINELNKAWAAALAGERLDLAMQAAQLAAGASEGSSKIAFGQKVLDAALLSGNPTWIAAAHEGMGWIYQALDQPEYAIGSFRAAKEMAVGQPFQKRVRLEWALGRALRLGGHVSEATLVIYNADASYKKLGGLLQSMGDAEWTGRLAEEQGELAILRGDLSSALRQLRRAQRKYRASEADTHAPELMDAIEVRIAELRMMIDIARSSGA